MTSGYYLYGVGLLRRKKPVALGQMRISGEEVKAITHKNICAVVREVANVDDGQMPDQKKAEAWVRTHHMVVEYALKKFDALLPVALGSVMKGPPDSVVLWLKKEYPKLVQKLEKVKDKAEYGVQIFWQPREEIDRLVVETPRLKALQEQMSEVREGTAYMVRQSYEKLLREAMEQRAEQVFRSLYAKIKSCSSDTVIEKIKPAQDDRSMLLHVSSLADKQQAEQLGEVLEDIKRQYGYGVRFTGPWPPYSFARA